MNNKRWILFKRTIGYEWDYVFRKFKLSQKILVFVAVISVVITGLGDTQSFFLGENSPIPQTWKLLKDPRIVFYLSIIIILLGSFVAVFLENQQNEKENNDVLNIVQEYVVPGIDDKLQKFQEDINQQFELKGNIRLSLWIPVRKSFLNWNLQMVCRTDNIPDRELKASFRLDEGVIGYTYLKNRGRYRIESLDISNAEQLPESYVNLRGDNEILIARNIKGVLAVVSFVKSSVLGLLAIDTDNVDDLSIIKSNELHSLAVDWVIEYTSSVRLLWRMKNNI